MKKLAVLSMFVLISLMYLATNSFFTETSAAKGKNLEQMPSVSTDFPNDDTSALKVDVFSAKKDIIDTWHIKGQVTNTGTEALEFVKVVGHFFDNNNQTVGVTTCCYAHPHTIETGHTATFDSFVGDEDTASDPDSFRLSFDWR